MKKISILVPCYNEEENVREIAREITKTLEKELSEYDYEIIFIDNNSKDKTRLYIRELCEKNNRIKAIFNVKNFGQFNSPYYGLCQTSGNCIIAISCDFQDPVEMIPQMVHEWEKGSKIVCAIKETSKENKIVRFARNCYYKVIKKISEVDQIEHFTGFGLYDESFIDILRKLDDPTPFLRGIVAEFGYKIKFLPYEQAKRRAGKTHNNWYSLYDAAMLSFTSYTKIGLRIATIGGFLIGCVSMIIAIVYLILKLVYWDSFDAGVAPMLLVVLILGALQLFFLGFMGEYILSINKRVMKRPLVIEEERINF